MLAVISFTILPPAVDLWNSISLLTFKCKRFHIVLMFLSTVVLQMIPLDSFVGQSADGKMVPIIPGGNSIPLTFSNRKEYVERAIEYRLHEIDRQVRPRSAGGGAPSSRKQQEDSVV